MAGTLVGKVATPVITSSVSCCPELCPYLCALIPQFFVIGLCFSQVDPFPILALVDVAFNQAPG